MSTSSSDPREHAVRPAEARPPAAGGTACSYVRLAPYAARLFLFFLLLGALQSLVWPAWEPEMITRLKRHLDGGADIVVFGNSTAVAVPGDTMMASIPDLIGEFLPNAHVGAMIKVSSHLELFRDFSVFLKHAEPKPKIVVIPVNLHSFSPRWHRRPEYQFPALSPALRLWHTPLRIFYQPLLISGWWDLSPVTEKEFLDEPVYDGDTRIGLTRDFMATLSDSSPPGRARQLIFFFMNRIQAEHPKALAMLEAARHLRAAGIRPVFYVMPVDIETGRRLVGERFPERIAKNAAVLRNLMKEDGFDLLDFSTILPPEEFARGPILDEHITYKGRREVARRITEVITSTK